MFKRLKENEKGLTLIELLVVIVILGIIAAIAIVAIGGIIDNSRKDAHISNAKQLANAAKLYIAGEDDTANKGTITLEDMIKAGYIEPIKDPSAKDKEYSKENSKVEVVKSKTTGDSSITYKVTLQSEGGQIYINAVDANKVKRDEVELKTTTTTP